MNLILGRLTLNARCSNMIINLKLYTMLRHSDFYDEKRD